MFFDAKNLRLRNIIIIMLMYVQAKSGFSRNFYRVSDVYDMEKEKHGCDLGFASIQLRLFCIGNDHESYVYPSMWQLGQFGC
jgi:hypothetical protein